MIIGALVIKNKMNLSDEETILAIQENPYMQYFVGYIDKLCKCFSLVYPTTYYKSARASYLEIIKCNKNSKSLINKGKSHLLSYLVRDIRSFIDLITINLITINGSQLFDGLKRNEKKIAGAILEKYHQQEQMFKEGAMPVPIVSSASFNRMCAPLFVVNPNCLRSLVQK